MIVIFSISKWLASVMGLLTSNSRKDRQHPEYIPFAMIHDAGYWYVPEDKAEEAAANVTEIMDNLLQGDVRLQSRHPVPG